MDDLRGHLTPKVVHSSPDLPRLSYGRYMNHGARVCSVCACVCVLRCVVCVVLCCVVLCCVGGVSVSTG